MVIKINVNCKNHSLSLTSETVSIYSEWQRLLEQSVSSIPQTLLAVYYATARSGSGLTRMGVK
jgi:hypothetical protein